MSKQLAELTPNEITDLARGIVTGNYLIADLEDQSWQSSLVLIADAFTELTNIGAVLVPVAPHLGGLWINGTTPGVTLEARPVAAESTEALNAEIARMNAALHPNG